MASPASKHILQTAHTTELAKTKLSEVPERPSNAIDILEACSPELSTLYRMSEWTIDETEEFLTSSFNIRKFMFETTGADCIPNAWGYFAGGHTSTQEQRAPFRFELRMLLGTGMGVFVRAERFYHVPQGLRMERPVSKNFKPQLPIPAEIKSKFPIGKGETKLVMVGDTPMKVVCEGLYPFRMWSTTLGDYIPLKLRALVVEDLQPDQSPKGKIDVWWGGNSIDGPQVSRNPKYGKHGAFVIDTNIQMGLDKAYHDVGAWTRSTTEEHELRPVIDPSTEKEVFDHLDAVSKLKSWQIRTNLLSKAAAGIIPPTESSSSEEQECISREALERLINEEIVRALGSVALDWI